MCGTHVMYSNVCTSTPVHQNVLGHVLYVVCLYVCHACHDVFVCIKKYEGQDFKIAEVGTTSGQGYAYITCYC